MKQILILAVVGLNVASLGAGCSGHEADPQPAPEAESMAMTTTGSMTSPLLQINNARMSTGGILTAGQPTPEQLEVGAEQGIKTVINLRTEGEEGNTDPELVESLGMHYVEIPVAGVDDLNENNARLLASVLAGAEKPAMVHCGSSNRVGALFALKAFYVDGLSAEESLEVGRSTGLTRLEPVVREKLGLPDS